MTNAEIGQLIKDARKRNGLTRAELGAALAAPISKAGIAGLEAGNWAASETVLREVFRVLSFDGGSDFVAKIGAMLEGWDAKRALEHAAQHAAQRRAAA